MYTFKHTYTHKHTHTRIHVPYIHIQAYIRTHAPSYTRIHLRTRHRHGCVCDLLSVSLCLHTQNVLKALRTSKFHNAPANSTKRKKRRKKGKTLRTSKSHTRKRKEKKSLRTNKFHKSSPSPCPPLSFSHISL